MKDNLEYIIPMLRVLIKLAAFSGGSSLVYYLEMAVFEAEHLAGHESRELVAYALQQRYDSEFDEADS